MNVNTENPVSITEANRNFSCVAHSASDEDIIALSKLLIKKNREAYEVLAKWLFSQGTGHSLHVQLIAETGGAEGVRAKMNIKLDLKRCTDLLVWKKA